MNADAIDPIPPSKNVAVDPIEVIPPPDAVCMLLAQSLRRSDLLRSLLQVARRKAAYDQGPKPAELIAEATRLGLPLTTGDRLPNPKRKKGVQNDG